MGTPDPVLLIEAGPGRGTLMADALRAVSRVGARVRRRGAACILIETSPRLRAIQAAGAAPPPPGTQRLADVPQGAAIAFANEFLDALPIRPVCPQRWHLARTLGRSRRARGPCSHRRSEHRGGRRHGPGTRRGGAKLGARPRQPDAAARRGGPLLLDYGPFESGLGDSLQALRRGSPAYPLSDPGHADLTAHVDFAALANVAREQGRRRARTSRPGSTAGTPGDCTAPSPLGRRARVAAQALALMDSAHRLAQPDRMGALFKALAICHPALPHPTRI